jgi:prepilin-type N-terminal cleavage/methylation domain-containing protein
MTNDRGMTLIEVLVALAILVGAAGPLVALADAALLRTDQASREEARYQRASEAMTRIALLPRVDLERRLGVHYVAEFQVSVQRPSLDLFRLAVSDSTDRGPTLLVTVVYRQPRAR